MKLSVREFEFFRSKIFDVAGISLSNAKSGLLQSRLQSRVAHLGLEGFKEYRTFLEGLNDSHDEWEIFTNLLTTNKTDWFREPNHFDFLANEFLPIWKKLGKKHLRLWCAASSTGEEPYTLAMVLHNELKNTGITFEILATDIDTKVLGIAQNGVYHKSQQDQIPTQYHSAFCYGTGEISEWMKVRKEIKASITFGQFNLSKSPYVFDESFDIVFCRNVLIYFSPPTVQTVVNEVYKHVTKDGVLVIAHSESLQTIQTAWEYLRPSIYQKGKLF